jgi:hypothetical protein
MKHIMANATEVKEYLGYWFQLGKGVVFPKSQAIVLPNPIFAQQYFSPTFEACWQRIITSAEDCYLEGTEQSLHDLLTPEWEIIRCARCTLPIPTSPSYIPSCLCPCVDLDCWPNSDLPHPRLPINRVLSLRTIHRRLLEQQQNDEACVPLSTDNLSTQD